MTCDALNKLCGGVSGVMIVQENLQELRT